MVLDPSPPPLRGTWLMCLWLFHMSCVLHDPVFCVILLIYMYDMTHSRAIRVMTRVTHMSRVTHMNASYLSQIQTSHVAHTDKSLCTYAKISSQIWIWVNVNKSYRPYERVIWLHIHTASFIYTYTHHLIYIYIYIYISPFCMWRSPLYDAENSVYTSFFEM